MPLKMGKGQEEMNSLEQVMGTHMTAKQVQPYPSEQMPAAMLQNLDMSRYIHRISCECPACEAGRKEAGTKVK